MYDIMEPSESLKKPAIAVGIDFGTTNSLIAAVIDGECVVIPDSNGSKLLPSVVAYDSGVAVVGQKALSYQSYIKSIKSLFGKSSDELQKENLTHSITNKIINEDGKAVIEISGMKKLDVEIASEIIKELKARAEKYLSSEVNDAVITVPAYFDDASRNCVREAARLAGFNVMRLINEPTSAAYAYGLDSDSEGTFLVYDLGGGTFDVSILQMQRGICEVLATSGDRNLGGDNIDEILAKFICDKRGRRFADLDSKDMILLLKEAKKIKEHLSYQNYYSTEEYHITSQEFNTLISPLIDKTADILDNLIAEIDGLKIDKAILVGGSTKIPYINNMIKNRFHIVEGVDPDEIVVRGAAIKAYGLAGNASQGLLIDVTPLSLGIELADGMNEVIIPRNTPIPAIYKHVFSTGKDNQTGFVIHVLQGESQFASKCRSLARFYLKNLQPLPKGSIKVEVTFQIDADGILTVSATELQTNRQHQVVIKPSYGLNEEEILKLVSSRSND